MLPVPEYRVESFILKATIRNVGENAGEKLNKRELEIINLIKDNPSTAIDELKEKCSISTRTIERNITSLKKKGYLVRKGSDKQGEWIVVSSGIK